MRRLLPAVLLMWLLCPCGLAATSGETFKRHPYDYAARRELVAARRAAGDYASAYYHAAWLAWLASREYADDGLAFLRDRGNRDRASHGRTESLTPVLAAVEAQQLLGNTCFNGAIAQQAPRLGRDIGELLARAQTAASQQDDPLVRLALARLGLTLDDVLVFENATDSRRPRVAVLRAAAGRAEAAAAALPESPGSHRTLALIRGRLAELDNRAALWEVAIAEAQRAYELDSTDPFLVELLWNLHLRAGHWEQAKVWEKRLADSLAADPPLAADLPLAACDSE